MKSFVYLLSVDKTHLKWLCKDHVLENEAEQVKALNSAPRVNECRVCACLLGRLELEGDG